MSAVFCGRHFKIKRDIPFKICQRERKFTMKKDEQKTNAIRFLGQNPDMVFKTLVTVGKSGNHYVFMIPVAKELDLRKAAKAVGEKNVEMIKSKELLPLTGYIHGGCSPVGMKKFFTTTIDETAKNFPTIMFSGGAIGIQIETSLSELSKVIRFSTADLTKD